MDKKVSPKKVFLKKLGERIIEERTKIKLSQVELAHICNKDAQSLERVENGKINPSACYLYEIAEGLNIPVKSFFDF